MASVTKKQLKDMFIYGDTLNQRKWTSLIDTIFNPKNQVEFDAGIKADTIDENTSGSGVTIDGVLIKDYTITSVRKSIINATGSTQTLTAAQSGSLVVLDRAAGCDVTLPADEVGLTYDFVVKTSVTSNDYSINGAATSDLLIGGIQIHSSSTLDKVTQFSPDGTDDDVMSMNGTTTGGEKGTYFTVTCIATNRWHVSGVLVGTGVFTNPFL